VARGDGAAQSARWSAASSARFSATSELEQFEFQRTVADCITAILPRVVSIQAGEFGDESCIWHGN
jgi:hypothetical protein